MANQRWTFNTLKARRREGRGGEGDSSANERDPVGLVFFILSATKVIVPG